MIAFDVDDEKPGQPCTTPAHVYRVSPLRPRETAEQRRRRRHAEELDRIEERAMVREERGL
ncbi:MAG: hypothetical protein HOW73_17145 [Polyangiaceae bacterium]|nr:hypothetical protein [Polyangiaceae bacterium]